jgi:hypothetical protein
MAKVPAPRSSCWAPGGGRMWERASEGGKAPGGRVGLAGRCWAVAVEEAVTMASGLEPPLFFCLLSSCSLAVASLGPGGSMLCCVHATTA